MSAQKPGFILIATFMMLSVAAIIVMRIYYKGSLYNLFIPVVKRQIQAKQLALSGVQMACAQLALHDTKIIPFNADDEAQQKKNRDPQERRKNLLKTLLYVQNRWQIFTLEEDIDGLEATVAFCITCEDGKIPLGALIDYGKRTFLGTKKNATSQALDGEELVKFLCEQMKPFAKGYNLFEPLERHIKTMKYRFVDIAELLKIKEFKTLRNNLYYQPLHSEQNENQAYRPQIYLADLFTLWNDKPTIDPLLFSPSVRLAFGLQYPAEKTQVSLEAAQEVVEKFPFSHSSWEKDWDTYLKPWYKKEYKNLSKLIQPLLSSKFGPHVFSVLCYGKLGHVQQKLIAIIERSFTKEGEVFSVKKLYWV